MSKDSKEAQTHFADDATLDYIARLEAKADNLNDLLKEEHFKTVDDILDFVIKIIRVAKHSDASLEEIIETFIFMKKDYKEMFEKGARDINALQKKLDQKIRESKGASHE